MELLRWACLAPIALLALVGSPLAPVADADEPLQRIAIRKGRFVEAESGAPFTPLGVNYYRIANEAGKSSHAAFCPGTYDAGFVEDMMAHLATLGLNTVRVFHSALVGPSGLIESSDSTAINPAYLANVLHFLRSARAHRVHVIFTWDIWLPAAMGWAKQPFLESWEPLFQTQPRVGQGVNSFRFALSPVRTRAAGIVALIHAIRAVDPTLLSVVLAWELENEVRFAGECEPFVSRPQTFAFAGETFDVSTDAGAQALMDAATATWACACADAIHEADEHALVSASVFTFHAVGRQRPGTLSQDTTRDMRIPCAPRALLQSRLDFIDIHVYANRGPTEKVRHDVQTTLASVEFPALLRDARRLGKPILAGEVGVPAGATRRPPAWRDIHHDVGQALLTELVGVLQDEGFAGALFWHYGNLDSREDDEYPAVQLHTGYGERLRAAWNP